ncbi:sigma-54 dependent transcriptional regulator, gfr operon transcriptional activator [Enterococcus sp. AZ194]|uniref:sigma 54-interacting transcriptional regulator n=1 Tax=Enterococcus sp. AZ194 TaxID=2774629 RepID=UPI003F298E46
MKEELINYLNNQTDFIDLNNISELFTAKKLAEIFKVKRNTISHYLNQLTNEGKLVKINSRPVYFFHKEAFERHYFILSETVYRSAEEIQKEQPLFGRQTDFFSLMIGHDKSLNRVIEQIKTALNYPDNGLPVLITGDSGTGKSYLVQLVYQYCLEHDLISEDAPFVTFNCAQYANNPELLTSNLFGHTKGAYTGAEEDKSGAFEHANGGILFLDEVHRLNAEGQEKLFTYLDQGIIYRMGDTGNPRQIETRLFFATTEELTSTFLTTFIRRIPIQVVMPAIKERSRNERVELVYSFLLNERRKINKAIQVSGQVISLLTSRSFKGNIGELKNVIKVTVAKAYIEQKNEKEIQLTIYHLPDSILDSKLQGLQTVTPEKILLTENTTTNQLVERHNPNEKRSIATFEKLINEFQQAECQLEKCETQLKQTVDHLFDYLLFETDRQQNHELLVYLTQYIRDTFRQMESAYQIKFNGNSVYALSYYLFQRGSSKWFPEDNELLDLIKEMEQQIKDAYPTSFHYVERLLDLSKHKLDLDISAMDRIVLALYLKKADWTKERGIPKAVIVAHGYATASSIANVANRFLGKDIFESFDMPLDVSPQRIAEEILDYSENNDISNGLVILVDMGSLKEIYQYFPKQITVPIAIMNNVTTPLAIAVGENLQKKLSLSEITERSASQATLDWKIIYPEENRTKALLTTCQTGIGTAAHISHLLEKSLPSSCNLKVLPYEFQVLADKKKSETVFSAYDVLGIIGTDNPYVEQIPYLSLEELISGDENQRLNEWLETVMTKEENQIFNKNVIRNFSLEKVIDSVTILDTEKVMKEIDLFMRELELQADLLLSNAKKLALYVHVSCLIERLIRNVPIDSTYCESGLNQCRESGFEQIRKAFSVIESVYSVKIPDAEIVYIYDIVYKETDTSTKDDDF